MKFNNRFTFLKHKYFHINFISSSSSTKKNSLNPNTNKAILNDKLNNKGWLILFKYNILI